MVDKNSIFGGMLTTQGAAKKTNCDALGIPWEPRYMLIGDANGTDPVPSSSQTKLVNQVYRAQLNQLRVSPTDDNVLIAELVLPPDVGGWWIRELALEDKDGVFSAVANAAPSYKPLLAQGSGRNQVVRMHIVTSGTANIQLKIDPSVVLATREYVDQKVLEELGKLDFKHSVRVATTAPVVLIGLQTIDGVALVAGDRVLVKNQAVAKDNGLYVAAAGVWARSADADSSLEVTPGLFVHVERGTINGDSIWQLVTDAPIALGVTDLLFEMAAGRTGINAGTYRSVTVDKYGRVVGGTNPTTLAGYAITDAFTKTETLDLINGTSQVPLVEVSTSRPLVANELGLVLIDASAGALIVDLPDANSALGVRSVVVRRVDNTSNRLTIKAAVGNKIKFHTHLNAAGYSFFYLMGAGDYWHLRSDGKGNWIPIARLDGTALGRPVFETTTVLNPGGHVPLGNALFVRADWPWLWDHAQQSGMLTTEAARAGMEGGWTTGDGASTFRSPDPRGKFVRHLDEAAGIDPGRPAGSYRLDDFKSHGHYVGSVSYGTQAMGGGSVTYAAWSGGYTGAAGGAETVPKNIAWPGRIKVI
ncbi:phage tail-collar fiber domain-containing protein [Pseudomonas sp. LjRoot263]|uniref:phage tail-collar fiber domain-containing protein n=1 Tax=Pseudomonas sp. LjRoot263 TaxID=3342302 RepID=UPI003ED0D46F